MKIYTRTGDKGDTSLFTGDRVPKNNPTIMALGAVDSTNAAVGLSIALLPTTLTEIRGQLLTVQHALFDLGASIATPLTHASKGKLDKTRFDAKAVTLLEQWMDAMDLYLAPLKTFILPGGHAAAAAAHQARANCREAERSCIPLLQLGEIPPEVVMYLNRLSDYLFMASRAINHLTDFPETKWDPHHKPE